MKKNHLILILALAGAPMAFAGQEISDDGKDTKEMKQTVTEEPLFKDTEFQLGDYATYGVGNGPTHVGLFRNHAWGEGGEANFYFLRYFGIGAEYSESYAQKSPDTNGGRFHDHIVDTYHFGGNLFFRWPIESWHLAPYAYLGGGADLEDRKWASGWGGVGFEYRILQHWLPKLVPERISFFTDGRFTYLGDRYFPDDGATRGNLNYFTVRAGFRFTY
jgi:hypothetical protein